MNRLKLKKISSYEKKVIFIVIFFVVIICALPNIFGYLNQDADVFLHFSSIAPGDRYVYYSYITQVLDNNYFFENLYTTEPQQYKIFNSFWLSVGLFAKLFNLNAVWAFEFFKLLLIVPALIIIYLLLSYCFKNIKQRLLGFLLLSFSSGIGAITYFFWKNFAENKEFFNFPTDLYMPEANFFLSMYNSPHFIASNVLFYLSLIILFFSFQKNKYKLSLLAGFCALFLFSFHPFHVVTIYCIPFFYLLFKTLQTKKIFFKRYFQYFIFVIISAPAVAYYFFLLKNDTIIYQKALQNICTSPEVLFLILGFGLIFLFAIYGIYLKTKSNHFFKNNLYIFFTIWIFIQLILIYSPFNFQRRLIQGLQLPLVFFATIGIYYFLNKIKTKKYNFQVYFLIIIGLVFSNFFNITRDVYHYYQKNELFYLQQNKYQALNWLKTQQPGPVLSEINNSNKIPGLIGFKIYIGHPVETLYFDNKYLNYNWFYYKNNQDIEKIRFLQKNGIKYVISNQEINFLEKIYSNQGVNIYKTKKQQ